jgi:hypothetical protein
LGRPPQFNVHRGHPNRLGVQHRYATQLVELREDEGIARVFTRNGVETETCEEYLGMDS